MPKHPTTTQIPIPEGSEEATARVQEAINEATMKASFNASPLTGVGLPEYLQDWAKTVERLSAPFEPEDLYFLPQDPKNGLAIAAVYATPRAYTERMNHVIGVGFWRSEIVSVSSAPYTKKIKAKYDYNGPKNDDGSRKILEPASELSASTAGLVARVAIWMGPVLQWVSQDSTGSEDTSDANWITSAEAQAYKRAISKWGPGNYFYRFGKIRYKYDGKSNEWLEQPQIPDWALPPKDCVDCGSRIVTTSFTNSNNETVSITAWDIFQRSSARYGVALCPKCSKARRDKETSAEAEKRLATAA